MENEDWQDAWREAEQKEVETQMARRRRVARLVAQTVGHAHEIDLAVGWLLDESCDIDDSTLDRVETLARLNRRHPMEDRNPSKTAIKNHIAYLCDLAK